MEQDGGLQAALIEESKDNLPFIQLIAGLRAPAAINEFMKEERLTARFWALGVGSISLIQRSRQRQQKPKKFNFHFFWFVVWLAPLHSLHFTLLSSFH